MQKNGTIIQFFEWYLPGGILWKKLNEEAASLAAAGFTAVWIPPAYKGSQGADDVGYSPYDIWDLGEFDQKGTIPTKYGTREDLQRAMDSAHENGLSVYADIVLDHMMGADGTETVSARRVEPGNRLADADSASHAISAWTHFTFPGRRGKYSDFEWHWYHFDGVDWDASAQQSGVFLFDGKRWDDHVDLENGNDDYLMGADLDLSDDSVVAELTRWGEWFTAETGVDGFRLDAIKHMKSDFYRQWIAEMRQRAGKELFSVGEYWNGDVSSLLRYADSVADTFSLFDVPLHFRMHDAATSNGSFDMRGIFRSTLVEARPQLAVTFADNHDTQPGQSLESFIPAWFKPHAYALILLREGGYPCVFYGDYYGMEKFPAQKDMIDRLLQARALRAYGAQHDYLDHPDIVGWTREGDAEHDNSGLAVLLTNAGGGSKSMYIGRQHAGRKLVPQLRGDTSSVVVSEDGSAVFSVPGGAAEVWTFA